MTGAITDREAEFRAYLLGVLPPERQEEIDERFLADEAMHVELQATADDLIHAYLAGDLSAPDRERFETHFLASPRRRERVAFVRSLLAALERAPATAGSPSSRPRWTPVLPWAAVLIVGLAAGGWSIGERRRGERDRVAAQQREDSLRRQLLTRDERVRELEGRVGASREPGDVATWTLRSGVERSPGASEGFTVGADWIRLRVLLEHDLRVSSYRASLQTSAGREILRVGGLREASRPEGRMVDVMVPGGLLRPGSYLLSVQRDAGGAPEELTATTFLVR
jgi:anti-sigma factor RsiW